MGVARRFYSLPAMEAISTGPVRFRAHHNPRSPRSIRPPPEVSLLRSQAAPTHGSIWVSSEETIMKPATAATDPPIHNARRLRPKDASSQKAARVIAGPLTVHTAPHADNPRLIDDPARAGEQDAIQQEDKRQQDNAKARLLLDRHAINDLSVAQDESDWQRALAPESFSFRRHPIISRYHD